MRPWASWTAKTAVFSLAAGFAATAVGLPGVALAAAGSTGSGQVAAEAALAGDVCNDAGALLGIIGAACQSLTLAGPPAAAPSPAGPSPAGPPAGGISRSAARQVTGPGSGQATGQGPGQGSGQATGQGPGQGSGQATGQGPGQGSSPATGQGSSQGAVRGTGAALGATVGQVIQRAVAPVTAVLGASGPVPRTAPILTSPSAVTGAPSSRDTGGAGASAPGADRTPPDPSATRAGDTNVPAASQLAGLGALPGLADLPSAGPASTPARNGAQGGISMPGTALSAASSGVSSDSFAALAVGALLAGASALKIAGRRSRDRKAGIGVVAQ